MIRVLQINHVAIRVDDVARSEAFYHGLLGLPVVPRSGARNAPAGALQALADVAGTPPPEDGLWIGPPGTQIHLIAAPETEGRPNPFGPHIAFEVEDLDEAKRDLDARGVAYVLAPERPGLPFRQLWLHDPDGHTIELWMKVRA